MKAGFIALLVSALFFSSASQACERCPAALQLNAEETAKQASWVLLGARTTPVPANERTTRSDLDFIEFKVERVLKAAQSTSIKPGQTIRINFMDGMCPYGFMIHHTHRVVIFANGPVNNQVFIGVNQGCAASHLPIDTGEMLKLGDKTISLETFAKGLHTP